MVVQRRVQVVIRGGGNPNAWINIEGNSLGISGARYAMFEIAAGHGYAKNAPADFVKRFDDTASQRILDIINGADKKYSEVRDKIVDNAFKTESWGGAKIAVAKANADYNERMAKIRAYAEKLRKIQEKFFSSM